MRIFFSVVSHLHHDVIINLNTLKLLSAFDNIDIVCCDNQPIKKLKVFCNKYAIHYRPNAKVQGFAENNNANFVFCKTELGMQENDYFILLNPDILIDNSNIRRLLLQLNKQTITLATTNLFLDLEEMVQDDNIRMYPTFSQFIKTYVLNDRTTMVNRRDNLPINFWASCAFMIFKTRLFSKLGGLDERYFMYCEDIDISYRAKMLDHSIDYLDTIKAVHFRRRSSKKLFSKYFFWHVHSVLKYSFIKKTVKAKKSLLYQGLNIPND
jgi:hypothetical protein